MLEEKKKRGRKPKSYQEAPPPQEKTLNNTSPETLVKNVDDVEVVGNPNAWKLICKASSKKEGWMKSTTALEIPGYGCVIKISEQQNDQLSVTSLPITGITILPSKYGAHRLISIAHKNEEEA